jgi:hypothetical protein
MGVSTRVPLNARGVPVIVNVPVRVIEVADKPLLKVLRADQTLVAALNAVIAFWTNPVVATSVVFVPFGKVGAVGASGKVIPDWGFGNRTKFASKYASSSSVSPSMFHAVGLNWVVRGFGNGVSAII